MALFEKSKAAARDRKAGQAAERAERAEQAERDALVHKLEVTQWRLDRAREIAADTLTAPSSPVPPKKGEHVLYVLDGAGLVEPRRGPGQWQGGSQAVSVRVPGTKSMRYRVGGTRGTYVQGDEKPTVIDTGVVTITDQRAVFLGPKQSREWAWAKLVGFNDDDPVHWTGIAVSNRQKVSGVSYPQDQAVAVRFYLETAVAKANDQIGELITELEGSLAAIGRPRPALDPLPAGTPADWYPDPSGRHPDRHWDGERWSRYVRDAPGGTRSEDPPYAGDGDGAVDVDA